MRYSDTAISCNWLSGKRLNCFRPVTALVEQAAKIIGQAISAKIVFFMIEHLPAYKQLTYQSLASTMLSEANKKTKIEGLFTTYFSSVAMLENWNPAFAAAKKFTNVFLMGENN